MIKRYSCNGHFQKWLVNTVVSRACNTEMSVITELNTWLHKCTCIKNTMCCLVTMIWNKWKQGRPYEILHKQVWKRIHTTCRRFTDKNTKYLLKNVLVAVLKSNMHIVSGLSSSAVYRWVVFECPGRLNSHGTVQISHRCFVGCDTTYSGRVASVLRRNVLPPS